MSASPSTPFSIGVDLGGTNLRVAAFDAEWNRLSSIALPTRVAAGPEAVAADMAGAVRSLLKEIGPKREFRGVGVGSPGPLELPAGKFREPPNLPGFDGFELRAALESALQCPVFIECDARAAALAEWTLGAGRLIPGDSMCMLTLGTGVGGGILLNGKLWHGMTGMAGENGHIALVPDGLPCGCGGRGCLEQYASATAIQRAAKKLAASGQAPGIARLQAEEGEIAARSLAALARSGDLQARSLFADLGGFLGMGLTALVNTLNLPLYVIGGGLVSAWDLFAPSMFENLRRLCYVYRLSQPADPAQPAPHATNVAPAVLGSEAGLLGAAMLPCQNEK